MITLRDQIAAHIEKHLWKHQRVAYNHRDVPEIETDQEVYLNLADAIIPMVKADLNKKKVNVNVAQSEQEPKFTITIEQLKANGWKITGKEPFLAIKHLGETDEPQDDIKLVIHTWNNSQQFALVCPDGTMIGIGPYTIEELNLFERMILSVDPSY